MICLCRANVKNLLDKEIIKFFISLWAIKTTTKTHTEAARSSMLIYMLDYYA